mmetsp:Transcript_8609/g.25848  ORF Transcript_8609/g.25848 Transcript_8609/m.25848 type:complete len:300 (+) Transcript_8609:1255-2154(+)
MSASSRLFSVLTAPSAGSAGEVAGCSVSGCCCGGSDGRGDPVGCALDPGSAEAAEMGFAVSTRGGVCGVGAECGSVAADGPAPGAGGSAAPELIADAWTASSGGTAGEAAAVSAVAAAGGAAGYAGSQAVTPGVGKPSHPRAAVGFETSTAETDGDAADSGAWPGSVLIAAASASAAMLLTGMDGTMPVPAAPGGVSALAGGSIPPPAAGCETLKSRYSTRYRLPPSAMLPGATCLTMAGSQQPRAPTPMARTSTASPTASRPSLLTSTGPATSAAASPTWSASSAATAAARARARTAS